MVNYGSGSVSVITTATNAVTATVPVGTNPRGIAITPDGTKVFVTNWGANTVSPINTTTNTAGLPITVGASPVGIAVTPDGSKVYVANNGASTVSSILTTTSTVGATIAVGNNPFGVAFTPDGATAYVTNQNSGTVSPITTATDTAGTAITVGSSPSGVAITPDGTKAYVANFTSNTVTPITVSSGIAGAAVNVGTQPNSISVTPDGSMADLRSRSQAVRRCFLRHDAPPRGRRGGGRQPDHPQVAHRPAPDRRPALGLGRLLRHGRLLPRLLHARVELRPGHAAPVPRLERSLRETEFGPSTRTSAAIRPSAPRCRSGPPAHDFHAAADGQLGGIMKVYREWRISGDTDWLRRLWPKVTQSLDYCIETWDPEHKGWLRGAAPQHLRHRVLGPRRHVHELLPGGAWRPPCRWARPSATTCRSTHELLERGVPRMEDELFNGEYFIQKVEWKGLRRDRSRARAQASANAAIRPRPWSCSRTRGRSTSTAPAACPTACSGAWMALRLRRRPGARPREGRQPPRSGAPLQSQARPVEPRQSAAADLRLWRPKAACCCAPGPRAARSSLPFVYSDEVWTGIEYQVASHLMLMGMVDEGLEIVRVLRDRYDGRDPQPVQRVRVRPLVRPGHVASYALLQGLTGARYDAVEKVLYLRPSIAGRLPRVLCTATRLRHGRRQDGKPFVEVVAETSPTSRSHIPHTREGKNRSVRTSHTKGSRPPRPICSEEPPLTHWGFGRFVGLDALVGKPDSARQDSPMRYRAVLLST